MVLQLIFKCIFGDKRGARSHDLQLMSVRLAPFEASPPPTRWRVWVYLRTTHMSLNERLKTFYRNTCSPLSCALHMFHREATAARGFFPARYGHGEDHRLIPDTTGHFMGIRAVNDTTQLVLTLPSSEHFV